MDPVATLTKLLNTDRSISIIILAGMGVLAAAAIVSGWTFGNFQTAINIGLVIIGLGALILVVSSLTDPIIRKLIGYFLVALIFVITTVFTYAAVVVNPGPWIKPTWCLVRFWERCELVKDEIAPPPTQEVDVGPLTPTDFAGRQDYEVYIQFAGYNRGTIIDLAKQLSDAGWDVRESDQGGERIASAANLAQVRYKSNDQKIAAEHLAEDIRETGVNSDVAAVENPAIGRDKLEVWIGLK